MGKHNSMVATLRLPPIAAVVEAALEGLVLANVALIEGGFVPMYPPMSIRYQLEPAGEEDWKLAHNMMADGWADCEDIAAWYAAGHRVSGYDSGAVVAIMVAGPGKLHAITLLSDETIEDHCIAHGMRGRGA
jgi:hypothetical protein